MQRTFNLHKLSDGLSQLSRFVLLESSWETVWHKQLRKNLSASVYLCVCVYLPLFLGLQSLQKLDVFLRLCIDPDDLISRRNSFSEYYYLHLRFLVGALIHNIDCTVSSATEEDFNSLLTIITSN